MKVEISYKTDKGDSSVPYCAFTTINGSYLCEWSIKSFEEAKAKLLEAIGRFNKNSAITAPPTETVEIEIEQQPTGKETIE